jgi:glutamine amidotransferase
MRRDRRTARKRSVSFLIPAGTDMRVAIIDYGSGNLRSATKAFERAAHEAGIAAEIDLTADAGRVLSADRIVLPGVGAYADCAAGLRAVDGMWEAVEEAAIEKGKPFLGICVGMQLMSERGLEKTITKGFGWIAGDVKEITPADPALKIPQIGWNTIEVQRNHPLFAGIETGPSGLHAYFVHSYHLDASEPDQVLAISDYGGPVTAAVARDNLAGTQFHPEKSQALGLALIANFLRWKP